MPLTLIKKRNGEIVPFDRLRIENAIQKSAESIGASLSREEAVSLTDEVLTLVEGKFGDETPDVESVQDSVERKLVESDHFEIAKAYILYRAEHARIRAEKRLEELEKVEKNLLKIRKSNGTVERFDIKKIENTFAACMLRLPSLDLKAMLEEVKKNVYDGISTAEVSKLLVMIAKSFIERDPAYSFLAANVLLGNILREVFGEKVWDVDFDLRYRDTFKKNLVLAVEEGLLSSKLLEFDLEKLSSALRLERDETFTYLGIQTLYDRYFLHIKGRRIESPQGFWMRVAMGLALNEQDKEARAIEFYTVLSTFRFVSSTPTLFNAGTNHSQLSSCYLSTVEDALHHIFKVIGDNAQLSKWAGGIGNDWTNIRATGAPIKGTNGKSQGVIPFLKIVNDTAVAVNQGGKRKGAVCSYLETWHLDIEEFLELRKNTGDDRRRTHDMNTANWIPDLFMKRVLAEKDWTLFSPSEAPDLHDLYGKKFEARYEEYERMAEEGKLSVWKKIPALTLWRKMVTMLFETGHPWITFKDPCNIRSPQDHVGVVHSSNLCTEITLNNSKEETAVCNLGSINFASHLQKNGDLDWELLSESIKIGIRMLDNVVDINFYPTPETKTSNLRHRPVGLGIMGFQNVLYSKNLDFDSEIAVEFSDELMEFVSYHAIYNSSLLAQERGAYETFKGSKWDRGLLPVDTIALLEEERGLSTEVSKTGKLDWTPIRASIREYGMRNSNCMAIAPTATISNIAGCIPCIEPIYKNLYVKSNMGGEFTVINAPLVEELQKEGIWTPALCQKLKASDGSVQNIAEIPERIRKKYKEVFEISSLWLLRHAAVRGKWIDQSQSVNIFYRGTSGKDISDIYQTAWKMGLKTTYYLRTLGATQVEKSTVGTHGTHKRDFEKAEEPTAATILPKPKMEIECEACQ